MPALVCVLMAVAAHAKGVRHQLVAPRALQHLSAGLRQVVPEVCELHHEASGRNGQGEAVPSINLVGLQCHCGSLQDRKQTELNGRLHEFTESMRGWWEEAVLRMAWELMRQPAEMQ